MLNIPFCMGVNLADLPDIPSPGRTSGQLGPRLVPPLTSRFPIEQLSRMIAQIVPEEHLLIRHCSSGTSVGQCF